MQALTPNRWMRRTTFLCLVLLCVVGIAQTLHGHAQDLVRGDADKTRCTICVVGHSSQQAAEKISIQVPHTQGIGSPGAVIVRSLQTYGKHSHIRPPPASSL